ncbi:MAG: hypothetical protein C4520_09065, partial [Candidatus Abyssobacteria bacterium SURF_5]
MEIRVMQQSWVYSRDTDDIPSFPHALMRESSAVEIRVHQRHDKVNAPANTVSAKLERFDEALQALFQWMKADLAYGANRVGGGVAPADLSHHRAYGSVPRRFMKYLSLL